MLDVCAILLHDANDALCCPHQLARRLKPVYFFPPVVAFTVVVGSCVL